MEVAWGTLVLFVLLVLLIALLPTWPYSRTWGYYPGAIVAALLFVWVLLILFDIVVIEYPWAA